MYWACIDAQYAAWHSGIVMRAFTGMLRDGFTHDARLDGSRGVRGVTLDTAGHAEGIWIPITPISA
eukprot:6172416-Pleurochrysis_carterae.AAC.2